MLFVIIHLKFEFVRLEIAHENRIEFILFLRRVVLQVFLFNFCCSYHGPLGFDLGLVSISGQEHIRLIDILNDHLMTMLYVINHCVDYGYFTRVRVSATLLYSVIEIGISSTDGVLIVSW